MAGTRQIVDRRRTAVNISTVTHTMENVSAVKYRQFYKQCIDSEPFYDSLAQLAYLIISAQQPVHHSLLTGNDSKCNAILVIGSDRGLCGAYNNNIYRLVDVHIKMAQRFGRELKIYTHGRKVSTHLGNRGIEVAGSFEDFDQIPDAAGARAIADNFLNQYMQGQIGRLGVVYTRFYSTASQKAQTLTLLPLDELIDDLATRTTIIWPWELSFEDFMLAPGVEEIFDSLAKMMIRTSISRCFLDAAVSEHLARVVAMRSATDNANEMIEDLTKEYNLARQAEITTELLDIISGSFGN